MITAHSGSDGTPENSLEYVRYALSTPADALEVDVHPDGRGGFYLSHDPAAGACPDLREVFALLRSTDKQINCDLKEEGLELAVLALAREMDAEDRVILTGSVSPALAAKNETVRTRTFLNLERVLPEYWELYRAGQKPTAALCARAAAACRTCGVSAVNLYYPLCTPECLAAFAAAEIGISAWTVNEPEAAERLLRAGVRNLTTRRPVLLCRMRDGAVSA
jgi:glycerophosphoryl diester phosphodiesterase